MFGFSDLALEGLATLRLPNTSPTASGRMLHLQKKKQKRKASGRMPHLQKKKRKRKTSSLAAVVEVEDVVVDFDTQGVWWSASRRYLSR